MLPPPPLGDESDTQAATPSNTAPADAMRDPLRCLSNCLAHRVAHFLDGSRDVLIAVRC